MARTYTHRNLILWQKAQELAYQVTLLVQRLPQSWANAVIARQVVASSTSVGANIAEGHGRYLPKPHRNHLSIARGSLAETDSWLDHLRRIGIITTAEEAQLLQQCDELTAMLIHKIRALDRVVDGEQGTIREETVEYDVLPHDHPVFPYEEADYLL